MTAPARGETRSGAGETGPALRETAPAKVNLLLQVGDRRADGLHELCSLFASLDLVDDLEVEIAGEDAAPVAAAADQVECPGVDGPNLVEHALAAFRAQVPLPALRVTICKRIPIAAGLGGGSADAAAALRAANRLAGDPLDVEALRSIAASIGSDVPSQVAPVHALVTGAGEGIEPVELPPLTLVLVPQAEGLSATAVYAEADRIGATGARLDVDAARRLAGAGADQLAAGVANDLERAALSLRPELAAPLAALGAAGALAACVTGSGPTTFGLFPDRPTAKAAATAIDQAGVGAPAIVAGLR